MARITCGRKGTIPVLRARSQHRRLDATWRWRPLAAARMKNRQGGAGFMRVPIFVAILVAHVIVFLLFPSLWRRVSQRREEETAVVSISLAPLKEELAPPQQQPDTWQAPLLYRSAQGLTGEAVPEAQGARERRESSQPLGGRLHGRSEPVEQQQAEPATTNTTPDWRAQAEETAQLSAQRMVETEDAAKRRANALISHIKPLEPPRVPGPAFAWDYAPTHRLVPLPGGGFAVSLNDNCQLVVLPMPFIGCVLGKRKANGDLLKNRHPPMRFGDWQKR
jgi:hypothetical protein